MANLWATRVVTGTKRSRPSAQTSIWVTWDRHGVHVITHDGLKTSTSKSMKSRNSEYFWMNSTGKSIWYRAMMAMCWTL